MCENCKNKLNENEEIEQEETVESYDDALNYLAFVEEQKRIEIQDNPVSKVSKDTKNSEFYKNSICIAETTGEVFQKLLGYGIDYNNALAIASNLITNDVNLKLARIQEVKIEQSQI